MAIACPGVAPLFAAEESFETHPRGGFATLEGPVGRWKAAGAGQAEIDDQHSRTGGQALHLTGDAGRELELELPAPLDTPGELRLWAERWTRRAPFLFRIETRAPGGDWREVYNGDQTIRVGGFDTQVVVSLPAGITGLRFRSTTPPGSGVLIDDLSLEPARSREAVEAHAVRLAVPVLIGKPHNPVCGVRMEVAESVTPAPRLRALQVDLTGTTRLDDIESVQVLLGGPEGPAVPLRPLGAPAAPQAGLSLAAPHELPPGGTWLWVCVRLREHAGLEGRIAGVVTRVELDDRSSPVQITPRPMPAKNAGGILGVGAGLRIGRALRQRGDDGVDTYRIPGLATTTAGTLIAVYDIRRRNGRDLPGDIDVGLSRSVDGGQTWEPMRVIMDLGNDARWQYDGVGDPAVLVDPRNNRIWVAGVWAHGHLGWNSSGPGLDPERTLQLLLVHSDDDGRSWSQPVNVTGQVKRPEWRLMMQGPGRGIALRDGTLVFAAQYRAADGVPHSTLIHSRDRGATWTVGTGVKPDTTESQVVELGDGRLMINCRDNRGGSRTIATTTDLGATWQLHATDRRALIEPVCMASLLRLERPGSDGLLLFSNPNSRRGRRLMTLKVSTDEGASWPVERQVLYDQRTGGGYSCLSPVGPHHVGLLYEGPGELNFVRFSLQELATP